MENKCFSDASFDFDCGGEVHVNHPIDPGSSSWSLCYLQDFLKNRTRVNNQLMREFLAETLAMFIFTICGLSSIAQSKFISQDTPCRDGSMGINLAFGFGVASAILVGGKVSGAHINPTVSFAMMVTGRMSLTRFWIYLAAQLVGSFFGSFMVFLLYFDALKSYKPGMYSLDSAGIFITFPNPNISFFGMFFDQIVSTVVLVVVLLALVDQKNFDLPPGLLAIFIGFFVVVLGSAFAYNTGCNVNPMRDFGPRLFTFVAGWGTQVFTIGNYFFWIPIVAPLIGCLIGCLVYFLFVSNHW